MEQEEINITDMLDTLYLQRFMIAGIAAAFVLAEIGRASCRERVYGRV